MAKLDESYKNDYAPSLCVTHNCNLSCIYCYQNHDTENRMSYETAQTCIDWIFANMPEGKESLTINLIGGEPLLEFKLIQKIYDYVMKIKHEIPVRFFASTNGTVLNKEMKKWISERNSNFILGLSLDGNRTTHNYNRSNSYDMIDFDFFLSNWPEQGVKMTLSEESLKNLADNIIFIHNLGFKKIDGVNLYEGEFDWKQDKFIHMLIPQLFKLKEFYLQNPNLQINQMLNKNIELCALDSKKRQKKCGIGTNVTFFDTDGERYPCSFVTPMTFSDEELSVIKQIDFFNHENFIDDCCYDGCYIYPICSSCAGANYLANHTFKEYNKGRCKINRLIAVFVADLYANRIIKYPEKYENETILYYTIEAIKKIKELYLGEFEMYLQSYSEE